ncbi:MAG: 2-oxoacid:acceptor oxidoreductase subunit alpha [Rhodospirillales bacterium]|nr:2-oxoacid:acceptor oxidoreductase subunit alpha [Rhodospirillales bacterium]
MVTETTQQSTTDSLDSVVIRFAGDSGDGIQLVGNKFAESTALFGDDLSTFPDYPAEIRAPIGTTYGVSAYQINFGPSEILTAGDEPDVLVALNPAALKVNQEQLREGGTLLIDTGAFTEKNIKKAGYENHPLSDKALDSVNLIELDITKLTMDAVSEVGLSKKEGLRCKNVWTLGLILWMFGRSRKSVADWIETKFAKKPEIVEANLRALNAGHAYGETTELGAGLKQYTLDKSEPETGLYRTITGSEAAAWGLYAGAELSNLELFLGSYPITPASNILHQLATMTDYGIVNFQAEDEIAAICSAIGAAYAGNLGVTTSSGPGVALKTEAIGLAVSAELPLVIVNVQRGGPSTGLPTKAEQSDLHQAVFGRNGDTPLPVVSASTPADCFDVAIEASRLATKYMTPVIMLMDGTLGNSSEPWKIPDFDSYEPFPVTHRKEPEGYHPFLRDPETLARNWAVPGTPGLEHRIGGLEKDYDSGNISYDAANHQRMTDARHDKVNGIRKDIPKQDVCLGAEKGKLAVVGWGSTYGAIHKGVEQLRQKGLDVSHIHLRHIWPLPENLEDLLKGYDKVIVPELNAGQLTTLLRAQYLLPVEGVNKVTGQPFKVSEIVEAAHQALEN